ncbi:MAG TPA: TIGR03571 family LLM class oxidoreductase [Aliidongia sp.]|nr:TIGR03571 family LLM class oxidoreductase [Aliidongia sp.]
MPTSQSAAMVFREGHLSLGFVLPLRSDGGSDVDFRSQLELANVAERLGFAALWVRDVPLNGPWYPESFGHLDPMVMLGALAARTTRIALGTAATVLTLRHPLHVAKAAVSLSALSQGRFILGLGSGDRAEEFAAFGHSSGERRDLFREHWDRLAAALELPPRILPDGDASDVQFELRPTDIARPELLAVGSGGQTLEWIARHAVGWATYHRPPEVQKDRYQLWRRAVDRATPGEFRSFSVAVRVELLDGDAPPEPIELGYRTGANGLRAILERMRDDGVHHVMLNLAPRGRPAAEEIEMIAGVVLPALG